MEENMSVDNTYEGPTLSPKKLPGWQAYYAKLKEVCNKNA